MSLTLRAARRDPHIGEANLRQSRQMLANEQRKLREKKTIANVIRRVPIVDNDKEMKMNWDRIEGNWKQFKGKVKAQWGKLTDDQLDVIAGKRESLAGKIQETYGVGKDATEKQLTAWQKRVKEADPIK